MKEISEDTKRALERIAMKASWAVEQRGGLEKRGHDAEDFVELSVGAIQEMLEQAYLFGKAN